MSDDEPFSLPEGVGELRFEVFHEYVSTACQHRQHDECRQTCKFCNRNCLCVCHRWAVEST